MSGKKTTIKTSKKPAPLSVAEPAVSYIVTTRNKKLTPLTDDDWALPGRPATDEEMEKLAEAMDKEKGGYTLEEARAITKKKIAAWKKANGL